MESKKIDRVFISYYAVVRFLERHTYAGAAQLESALFCFVSDETNDADKLNAWVFETAGKAITDAKAEGRALIVQAALPQVTEGSLEDDLAAAEESEFRSAYDNDGDAPEFATAYDSGDDEEDGIEDTELDDEEDNTPAKVLLTYGRINRFLERWNIAPLTGSPDSNTDMLGLHACVPVISDKDSGIEVLWSPTKVWPKKPASK